MALTDRLMDDLRGSLPGATDAAIVRELWNTINEACRTGWVWRETYGVTLIEGQSQYDIVPADTDVVQVLSVSHPTLDVSGAVAEFGKLYLTTPPAAADVGVPLALVLVLAPALSAGPDPEALIPQDMWSTFHQMWLHGVMGRMMAQPAKPYTNPGLALFHRRSFVRDMTQAKLQIRTGSVPAAQLWQFPRWA